MLYLKAFDREGNLVSTSDEVLNGTGQVIIRNLKPGTLYNSGDFYVKWIDDNYESDKIPLPSFKTLEETTNKEFIFYWNDALNIEPKSAYEIALENGFEGTEEEWLVSLKGEPGEKGIQGEKGEKGYSSVNQTRLPQILREQYFENLEIPVVDNDNGIIEQVNPLNAQTVNYYFIGNVLDINEPETKTTDFSQFQQGIVTMGWTDSSVALSNSLIQNYINTENTAFALLHIYNGKPVLDKAYISPSMREDYMNDLIKTFGNRNDFEIKLGKGIIFDISRRFTNLATLKTIVDEISANKGDYLQLHFSDNQGYSIHSEILGQNGTTSNDKYLTKKEIMELIDYANGKDVMIVPDFDVPSHSQGWLDSLKVNNPDLYSNVVSDYDVSLADYYGNDTASNFVESLIEEITTMFYQPKYGDRLVFSIGADEVPGVDEAQIDYVNFVNRMAKKFMREVINLEYGMMVLQTMVLKY
ncbi:hypothetical protein Alsa2_CDS0150 [Staphylococcus phage Alsa_2]|nr:hypothetical protein Alsa2_CDS0150 [Staphylococcus phage Alsa_2]